MKRILFVCTGNICRSPTAEAVLKYYVKEQGLDDDYKIESAGTHGYHVGASPDRRGVEAAKKRGISMGGLKARKVDMSDFYDFDVLVAMDRGHYQILEKLKPNDSGAHIVLFTDYTANYKGTDVPDPYYGDEDGFEMVLDILEEGMAGIIKERK